MFVLKFIILDGFSFVWDPLGKDFPLFGTPPIGRPSVAGETSEDEHDGSRRLLHRFTYFLMFINVSRRLRIDWEHPWSRQGAPGGRIAGFRGWLKKTTKISGYVPFKKRSAYIVNNRFLYSCSVFRSGQNLM